jgi:hypothetical protein
LHTLGLAIALRRGALDDAEWHGRRAIAINLEDEHAAPTLITTIARVALARDDLDRAGVLWGAVVGHGEHKLGMQYTHWREDLGKEARPAFVEALARGRKLELGPLRRSRSAPTRWRCRGGPPNVICQRAPARLVVAP